jgi:hypothetical protein
MGLLTNYRGRLTFTELFNMPIGQIQTLQYLAWKHRDDQKELREAETLEDVIEGNI